MRLSRMSGRVASLARQRGFIRLPTWIARWGSQQPYVMGNAFRQAEVGGVYLPYNPDTLLQRRNLLTYTEQFDNAAWTKSNVTVLADQVIAPDGLLTADKVTVGTTGSNLVNRTVTFLPGPGGKVTGSWHWKLGDGAMPWVVFIIYGNNGEGVRAWFNLATGVVGNTEVNTTATGLAASIVPAANGFYRITLTGVFASATSAAFEVDQSPTNGAYAGAAGFNYCWGAQFESGSLTPYQPVTDWATEYMGGAPLVRRNLLAKTNDLSDTRGPAGTFTNNATSTPAGTQDGVRFQWSATGGAYFIPTSTNAMPAGASTASVYIKANGSASRVRVGNQRGDSATAAYADVNPITGAFTTGSYNGGGSVFTGVSCAVVDAGNGWWRVSVTATASISIAGHVCMVSANLDAGGDVFVWGAQLEAGSFATAYQAITDWTTEYAADDARRLAVRSRILLWQDSTASVPVLRVEDPVGFIVDTSARYSRLGPNLVDTATFTDTRATAAAQGDGSIKLTTTGDDAFRSFDATNVAGKTYEITAEVWTDAAQVSAGRQATLYSYNSVSGVTELVTSVKTLTTVPQIVRSIRSFTAGATAVKFRIDVEPDAGAGAYLFYRNWRVREIQTDALPTGRGPALTVASVTVVPGTGTAVNNGDGTYTVANGGYVRFFYNLTDLVQGAAYEYEVPIKSYTSGAGGAQVDWCDVSQITISTSLPYARGLQARASYDNTYRFLDVAAGTGSTITVSAPVTRYCPGNHAFQPTPTARGALTARVNRLLKSQELDATPGAGSVGTTAQPWELSAAGINVPVANTTLAPDGTVSGDTVTTTASNHLLRQVVAVVPGEQVTFSWYAKDATFTPKYSIFNITGVVDIVAVSVYPAGTAAANGWTRYASTVTIPAGCTSAGFYMLRDSGATGSIALWGADVRTADDAAKPIPAYQRVNTATDYDTTGYPHGIRLDGVTQKYLTAAFAGSGGHHTMMAAFKHLGGGTAFGTLMEWGLAAPAHLVGVQRSNGTSTASTRVDTDGLGNQGMSVTGSFDGGSHVMRYTVDTSRHGQEDTAAEVGAALTGSADFADSAVLGIGSGPVNSTQFANIVLFGAVYLRSAAPPSSFEPMRKILARQAGMAA